jgi:type III restriction enzyme
MTTQTLTTKFDTLDEMRIIQGKYPNISQHITDNLSTKVKLRGYQETALKRFCYYLNDYPNKPQPMHLLYHMATGSGKTVIMASLILELYNKGYSNFIFFVDSSNIIEKTKANFLDSTSNKYLFNKQVKFADRAIEIKEVSNFEGVSSNSINIHFTTIQGLHSRIINPREDSLHLDDFANKKIVLLSDEAHHINATTKKKLNKSESENKTSWEDTVNAIFNANSDNILLEFTATIDLDNQAINDKYADKIIYDYSLKNFREDGYSKEVNVIEVDNKVAIERAFQAVILSQYRRKIAEKNSLHIKPVMLLKSAYINDSKSFRDEFHEFIKNLSIKDIEIARKRLDISPFVDAFNYFKQNNISDNNLVEELKIEFDLTKSIDINDTKELASNQIKVNTLEDKNNEVRVIFAVDKLNEGWDVLNLFDIVRLYDTRSNNNTIKEAQLIGRGARYCPFQIDDEQIIDKRKYDTNLDHELRILEELHYHSPRIPKYISEIKDALRKSGIMPDNRVNRELRVKGTFKQTAWWHGGFIYLNDRGLTDKELFANLNDYKIDTSNFRYALSSHEISKQNLLVDEYQLDKKSNIASKNIKLSTFEHRVIRSAIDKSAFYRFDNINKYFSHRLDRVRYFHELEGFVEKAKVEVIAPVSQLNKGLSNEDKISICLYVLQNVEEQIKAGFSRYVGTSDFKPQPIKDLLDDKVLKFADSTSHSDRMHGLPMNQSSDDFKYIDLESLDWYIFNDCFGTSEEKYFLKYIHDNQEAIKNIYEEFYVIRNERFFKIYNFDDGKPIEPDFVMLFKKRNANESSIYQIFVEPKGNHLLEHDKWKETFLTRIKSQKNRELVFQGFYYNIYGLPFYNESKKVAFDSACRKILDI